MTGRSKTDMSSQYEKRIIKALRQMTQYLDTHSRQLLKNKNITVPQILCLDELHGNGTTTVAVLANNLCLSASTTVGIVDRLEERKFVKRKRDGTDRRLVYVEITPTGVAFLEGTPHLMHNKLHDTVMKMSQDEQIYLANSLERLVTLLFTTEC